MSLELNPLPVPRPTSLSLTALEYDAFSRLDFWVFVQRVALELLGELLQDNWHIQMLCGEADRVRTGSTIKLAIAVPPRSLKSIIFSVALPAWMLGHDPRAQVVCVSYGFELAEQLSADCRRIMQSAWYRRLFPSTRLDRKAVGHLVTTLGGKRYATSVGGPLVGMGADLFIVDDPMKPDEALSDSERNRINAWARHTLFGRLDDKQRGNIIIVQQRLHEDDMIGHVLGLGFELLSIPAVAQEDEVHTIRTPFGPFTHRRREGEALHPQREPLAVLAQLKTLLGAEFFAAQYLQSPTPPGGSIVKVAQFNRYDPAHKPRFVRIIQSWDCAAKANELADYSVCTTWGITENHEIYLLHVFRARLEYPELKRQFRGLCKQFMAGTVLIEHTSSGIQLEQELRREGFAHLVAVKVQGDKIMRMRAQTPKIEAGRVFIPHDAPWLEDYLHELMMFPRGRHDDQVDSTAQALAHIGNPSSFENYMEYARLEIQRSEGRDPAIYAVTFDHFDPGFGIRVSSGRHIRRSDDGFYHCSLSEWECARGVRGVRLIAGTDW